MKKRIFNSTVFFVLGLFIGFGLGMSLAIYEYQKYMAEILTCVTSSADQITCDAIQLKTVSKAK